MSHSSLLWLEWVRSGGKESPWLTLSALPAALNLDLSFTALDGESNSLRITLVPRYHYPKYARLNRCD